jgi:hypothetical protein
MYKEGDVYVAEDYSATVVKEHTTDAGIVLQAAINHLPDGGHIAVRKAVYPVLSSVEVNKSDINISGEGLHNTCFRLNTNLSSFIKIGATKENIVLENLNFHANNHVATAIDASRATTYPYRMILRRCNIYGATSKNVDVTNREEVQISDCHIGDATQSSPYNVYQNGSSGWLRITDGSILHNASTYSVYFKGTLLSIVNADLHVKAGASGHLYLTEGSAQFSNAWTEVGSIRGVVGGGSWCNFTSACSFLNGGLGGSYTSIQLHGDKFWTSGFTHDVDITVNATRGLYGSMNLEGSHTFAITGKYQFYDVYAGILRSNW